MIGSCCAAWSLALAPSIAAPAQEPAAALPRRVDLDYRVFHGPDELDGALRALAEAYPLALHLIEIGRSRGGRPIRLAVLGEGPLEQVLARPALFAGDALLGRDLVGGEALLYALDSMLANRRREPALAALLGERALVLAPCLDPDARAERLGQGELARGAAYDSNFPIGWLPSRPGLPSGPFPLSLPETEALARFLVETPSVAALLAFAGREPAPEDASAPEHGRDAASHARLRDAAAKARTSDYVFTPAEALERRPGGLLEFSAELCGHLSLAVNVARPATSPEEVPSLGAQLARALAALAQELPALELREVGRLRLGPERWRVDLVLANRGGVATASELGALRFGVGALRFSAAGAGLVATTYRTGGSAADRVAGVGGGAMNLDPLAGREERRLSLYVDAPSGTLLTVEVSGARAGRAVLEAPLQ